MPIYPYSFQLPPLSTQDIPNNGAVGEFLGISAGGVLDWLPVAGGGGDMLKSENLSGLASYPTARTNLGLGTTDTPTFKNLVISTGSIATSAPVTISQTWDGTGSTVFKALVVNATTPGTTSSASSNLLDLQVGATSKLSVLKTGALLFSESGTSSVPIIRFPDAYGRVRGIYNDIDNGIGITSGGGTVLLQEGEVRIETGKRFIWKSGATPIVSLLDEGTGVLALRNGINPQTFRVYNTYTDASNYERVSIGFISNVAHVLSSGAGSGSAHRALTIGTGTGTWQFAITGSFLALADNTYDIGASGANRPRNVYVGSNVISRPSASITPANNSELVVEATSNTTLTFKLKGTDGTVRSATLTLAP
jgi:hypothetical protein